MKLAANANPRFHFEERRQYLIGTHHETVSPREMSVNNPDCAAIIVER